MSVFDNKAPVEKSVFNNYQPLKTAEDQQTLSNGKDVVLGLEKTDLGFLSPNVPARLKAGGDAVLNSFTSSIDRGATGLNKIVGGITGDGYYDTKDKTWEKTSEGVGGRIKDAAKGTLELATGGIEAFISLAYSPVIAGIGATMPELKQSAKGYKLLWDNYVTDEDKEDISGYIKFVNDKWEDLDEDGRGFIKDGARLIIDSVIAKGIATKKPVGDKTPMTSQQAMNEPIPIKNIIKESKEALIQTANDIKPLPFVAGNKIKDVAKSLVDKGVNKFIPVDKVKAAKLLNTEMKFGRKQLQDFQKYTGAKKSGIALPGQGETPGKWIVDRGLQKGSMSQSINERVTQNTVSYLSKQIEAKKTALNMMSANPVAMGIKNKSVDKVLGELVTFYKKTGNEKYRTAVRLLNESKKNGLSLKTIDNWVKYNFEKDIKIPYMSSVSADTVKNATLKNLDKGIRELTYDIAKKSGYKELIKSNNEIQAANQILNVVGPKVSLELSRASKQGLDTVDYVMLLSGGGSPASMAMVAGKKTFLDKVINTWKNKSLDLRSGSPIKQVVKGSPDRMIAKAKSEIDAIKKTGDLKLTSDVKSAGVALKKDVVKSVKNVLNSKAEQTTIDDAIRAVEKDMNRQLSFDELIPVREEFAKHLYGAKPIKEVVETAFNRTLANGGVTINYKGEIPKTGYSVSPLKAIEQIELPKNFTRQTLYDFYKKYLKLATNQNGLRMGTWKEKGKYYMDVSIIEQSIDKAKKIAQGNSQIAIYDIANNKTIYIKPPIK